MTVVLHEENKTQSKELQAPSFPPHHFVLDNSEDSDMTDEIAAAFVEDGFFVLKQTLEPGVVKEWQDFADDYFSQCFEILHKNGHIETPHHIVETNETLAASYHFDLKQREEGKCGSGKIIYALGHGAKNGFSEIVMRSPGRYELSLLHQYERQQRGDTTGEIPDIEKIIAPLQYLLPKLIEQHEQSSDGTNTPIVDAKSMKDLKLCHLSLLISTPGSTEQGWHADGGHVNIQRHLSCHCFNVFIPLQDIPLELGPTEFRPGGHFLTRNLGPMMLAAKCRKKLRPPVWPPLQLGDVSIFDYRILHRGKANTSKSRNRNVLVLTYCEPWFQDILNFPKRSMMNPKKDNG